MKPSAWPTARVLVVVDDYFAGFDIAAALKAANFAVIGPCSTELSARLLLGAEAPTHAVLDLDFGHQRGAVELAQLLKDRGVAVVFVVGDEADAAAIDFSEVSALHKSSDLAAIVSALKELPSG